MKVAVLLTVSLLVGGGMAVALFPISLDQAQLVSCDPPPSNPPKKGGKG